MLPMPPPIKKIMHKQEEYNPLILDTYGRFPSYMSATSPSVPLVSHFLHQQYAPTYPDNKPFAVCLTHDIDIINTPKISLAFDPLTCTASMRLPRTNMLFNAVKAITQPNAHIPKSKVSSYHNFKEIMDLEDKYEASSSFYILVQDDIDTDYNFSLDSIQSDLLMLMDNEHEIGLHGGFDCTNTRRIQYRKRQLERIIRKKITGYRNHYLKFSVPHTWEILSDAGFCYDATFGYADCCGFRNGMCHPFKPYNIITGTTIEILEIPLIVMDATLFDYMKLDTFNAWKMIQTFIDTTKRLNGVITILWHNTSMDEDKKRLYEKILKYCSEQNAWMPTSEELMHHWWGMGFYNEYI